MKKVLIVGATSRIAEEAARIWAQRGDHLFLVGRNAQRLEAIASDLAVRGALRVGIHVMDANDFAAHAAMFAAARCHLSGLDTVLIAHGSLPDQRACEQSMERMLNELTTNGLSAVSLLRLAGEEFEKQRAGAIGVISSVAGDRGRQSNYVYGSAKALVSTYASGLAQRLHPAGVTVVNFKPGFVDTPMTAQFKKGLLWAKAPGVAAKMVRALDGRSSGGRYLPAFWKPIMAIIRAIPDRVFVRLKL
jgi:decaprenylphospho-beta-D-erythro-pentofuranosid-2-ulose 2-reductase